MIAREPQAEPDPELGLLYLDVRKSLRVLELVH